jgi:hypothetical protein
MKQKTKPGRPSKYRASYATQAEKLCRLGATTSELADFFGAHTRTVEVWAAKHEAFCRAIKVGKAAADDRVERSLFQRAIGYSFETIKILGTAGGKKVNKVPFTQHVPPSTSACIFWLKNRRPEAWREVSKHEIETLSDRELASVLAVARRMAEAEEANGGGGGAEGSAQPAIELQPVR